MIDKIKHRKLTFVICIVLGLVTSGIAQDSVSIARQKLLQTVSQAKKETGYMSAALISSTIESIKTGKGEFVTEELVPDYTSFLKDKNIFVQRLGVEGLKAVKSPKAIEALFEYVKNKDYADWEKRLQESESNRNPKPEESMQIQLEFTIFRTAVYVLGESGESRFVPFLLELFKSSNPNSLEIMVPVEQALGRLGATKELFEMIPDADRNFLFHISNALRAVKDPNKTPELKSIIEDSNANIMARSLAVSTLSGIKANGVTEFIIDVINDKNYPVTIRQTAVGAASQIKNPAVEEILLEHAKNTNSSLRYFALVGLLRRAPDKYIDSFFETIMDPNEKLDFKRRLASELNQSIPQDQLKKYRKQLFDCLNASDRDGRPVDDIRVFAWCQIKKVFNEEPSVVINDKNSAHPIRYEILQRMEKESKNLNYQQRLKKADEETQRIVSVYDEKQNSEEKD
jgi:HEAT repeat protein